MNPDARQQDARVLKAPTASREHKKAYVRRLYEGFQQRHNRDRRRMQKSADHPLSANPPGFSKSRVYPPAVQLILTRKDLSRPLHSRGRDSRGILKDSQNDKNTVGSHSGRAGVHLVFVKMTNAQKSLLNPFRARFCAIY